METNPCGSLLVRSRFTLLPPARISMAWLHLPASLHIRAPLYLGTSRALSTLPSPLDFSPPLPPSLHFRFASLLAPRPCSLPASPTLSVARLYRRSPHPPPSLHPEFGTHCLTTHNCLPPIPATYTWRFTACPAARAGRSQPVHSLFTGRSGQSPRRPNPPRAAGCR